MCAAIARRISSLTGATAKTGTSRHDSPDALAKQIPRYAGTAIVFGLLFMRFELASLDRPQLHRHRNPNGAVG